MEGPFGDLKRPIPNPDPLGQVFSRLPLELLEVPLEVTRRMGDVTD
jgi:hypothetical protein